MFDRIGSRLDSLLALGVPPGMLAPEHRRRIQVITMVTGLILMVGLPFVVQYWAIGMATMSLAVALTMVVGVINVWVLRRTHHADAAGIAGTAALFLLLVASNLHSGGFYDPNFGWLYVIPMVAALTVNARAGWAYAAVVLLTTGAFWWASELGIEIPDEVPADQHAIQSLLNRGSAVLTIAVVLAALAAREQFTAQLLRRANEGLMAEMRQAAHMEARLVQSERLASMGSLAAGMAHEINNPLTWMIGNLTLVERELPQLDAAHASQLRPLVDDALDGAVRVARIVKDLRGFTRAHDDVRAVPARQVVDRALQLTAAELKHRATVETEVPADLVLRTNEARTVQVFVNLLTNAAHAIEAGDRDDNQVRVRARADQDDVLIEVSDTGCGMSRQTLRRAFEPLYTTKDVGVGTGLGLYVSRNILASLGGRLEIKSSLGEGTTVCVWLPSGELEEVAVPFSETLAKPDTERLRILAVDDEPAILRWLEAELVEHDVVTSRDPESAIKEFERSEFDVMLCDLMMPNITGVDVHRALRELNPRRAHRLVFISGGAFTPEARAFAQADGIRLLEKPLDRAELRQVLAEVAAEA